MAVADVSHDAESAESDSLSSGDNASSLLPVLTSVDTSQLDSLFQSDVWADESVSIGSLSGSDLLNTDPASFALGGTPLSPVPDNSGSGGYSGSASPFPSGVGTATGESTVSQTSNQSPALVSGSVESADGNATATAATGDGTNISSGVAIVSETTPSTPATPSTGGVANSYTVPDIEVSGLGTSAAYTNIPDGSTVPIDTNGTDFGNVSLNSTVTRTFKVTNTGYADLSIYGLSLPFGFSVGDDPLELNIEAGQSDTFNVTFQPTYSGLHSGAVAIYNNDYDESPYDFMIKGNVGGTPEIEVTGNNVTIPDGDTTPITLDGTDFGAVALNTFASRTFTVTNTGTGTLDLTGLSIPLPFTLASANLPATLAAGGSTSFTVGLSATASGTYTRKISISNSDSDENPYDFDVKAVVGGTPEIEIKGNAYTILDNDTTPSVFDGTDFGTMDLNTSMSRVFTVKNTGTGTLNLTGLSIPLPFTLTSGNLPPTLAAGGSASFTVGFSATASGTFTRKISIANDDSNENPYDFDIKAVVGTPDIEVRGLGLVIPDGDTTPTTFDGTDFGTVSVNTSASRTFTVTNTGNGTLKLTGLTIPSPFTLSSANLPPTLAAGGSVSLIVGFLPTVSGTYTRKISIANDDSNESPYDFDIKAIATSPPEINVTGLGVSIPDGDNTPSTLDGTDFGSVAPNVIVTRTFTVTNSGPGSLSLGTPLMAGGFSLGSDSLVSTLGPGMSDTFSVKFSSATSGTFTSTVTINNNDSDEAPYDFSVKAFIGPEIDVNGNGQSIADGDNTPSISDGTDFGSILAGTSVSRTFTVLNTGTNWLYLGTPSITGGFTLGSDTLVTSLGPGTSDTFSVNFTSLTATTFNGQVTIANNDNDESPYNFALKAVVTGNSEIDVFGNGVSIVDGDSTPNTTDDTDFGNVVSGATTTRTFTVQNTGNATFFLGGVYPTGGFTQGSNPLVSSLAPGASDTFSVNFSSSAAGTYTGQVSFSNNDSDESPYNFALKAVVIAPEIEVRGNSVTILDGDTSPSADDWTDFGIVNVGTTVTRTYTVFNTGNASLSLGTPTIPAGFVPGPNGLVGSLAPGMSDTFSVQFSPSTVGPVSGEISFINGDSNESPYNFKIAAEGGVPEINLLGYSPQGSVASIANNDLEPGVDDGTDFGTVLPGTTVTRLFTVENQGSGWLYLGTPVVTGTAFQLASNYLASPLAPYSSASFVVRFLSSVTGPFTGQISIGNSDSDESTYIFAVKAATVKLPKLAKVTYADVGLRPDEAYDPANPTAGTPLFGQNTYADYGHWVDHDLDGTIEPSDEDVKTAAAFVRNTKATVTVILEVQESNAGNAATEIEIRGTGSDGINFQMENDAPTVTRSGNTYTVTLEAATAFRNEVFHYDDFVVSWQVRIPGGDWVDAGTSATDLYLLLDQPVTPSPGNTIKLLQHTYVHLSSHYRSEQPITSEDALINSLWAHFDDLEVKQQDEVAFIGSIPVPGFNHELAYWKHYENVGDVPAPHPFNGSCNCGSFAALFQNSLGVHGVDQPDSTVYYSGSIFVKAWIHNSQQISTFSIKPKTIL